MTCDTIYPELDQTSWACAEPRFQVKGTLFSKTPPSHFGHQLQVWGPQVRLQF